MNETMKFLESPGVISTVGLVMANIGLAIVTIIQTVMYRRVRRRAELFKGESECIKENHYILLTDFEKVCQSNLNNKRLADELSATNSRLSGMLRSLREDMAMMKDNNRNVALSHAVSKKGAEDTHADVVASAKAYYRFLIGKV